MKVFIIERLDHYSWCENYKAVVVEKDALCAERKAILSIENTGA